MHSRQFFETVSGCLRVYRLFSLLKKSTKDNILKIKMCEQKEVQVKHCKSECSLVLSLL